ncbi:hypothetical protein CAT67_16840 [Acinetobacter baumannii]|uniref:hypothetical protein n=1 Tax=Acinetobacter baumannii TaxID=470 RepID=UPI000A3AF9DD|nr:hypothetical protein [Acinetobacter baumannii]OTT97800.1 hypothetical protein CAT67_16840 [Acinetobacter baumannii]
MQKFEPRPSEASIKLYERSEFRVVFVLAFAFSQSHNWKSQKIAPRIERKRDSIEFERSENQGQFFPPNAFNYFLKF